MTTRDVSSLLTRVILMVFLGAGLVFAAWKTVTAIRDSGRQSAFADARTWSSGLDSLRRAATRRQLDSMRLVVRALDSSARATSAEARGAISALRTQLAVKPVTLRETILVAAAEQAANSCTVALNSCEQFRDSATIALAKADSTIAGADSTQRALILRGAAASDSVKQLVDRVARSPSWGTVAKGTGAGAAVATLLCFFFCR